MTYATALTAVIARLTAASLVETRSPAGLLGAGAPRGEGAFAVLPLGDRKPKSRGRAQVGGLRVEARYRVQLGHQLKPGAGLAAPAAALTALHAAQRYLIQPGTSLTTTGAVKLGNVNTTQLQGGAYLVQTFECSVSFELDVSAP